MTTRTQTLTRAIFLLALCAVPSVADDRYIVQAHPSVIDSIARRHKLRVDRKLREEGLYLVGLPKDTPAQQTVSALRSDASVRAVENNLDIRVPELSSALDKKRRKIPYLKGEAPSIWMAGAPWAPYVNQPANSLIRIQDAQRRFGYGHSGVLVAVIDTGVDYKHPVLEPVLDKVNARDFVTGGRDASISQETTPFVDQETTPFVDGMGSVVLNQETTPFVDQETTPFVDQETTPFVDAAAYGHGTMVAGIIHLVAPRVRILPLKAFKSNGAGTMADVIEAIDYAVKAGAKVINMSFSAEGTSPALNKAIADAAAARVICIAAVANDHAPVAVYPSNIAPVIGVAATTNDDRRAAFSNYGFDVDIAAPGDGIVSTYPKNRYAIGWGTSFAAPFVAGTAALMRSVDPNETAAGLDKRLERGAVRTKSPELKGGRLDVFSTINQQ